MNTPVNVIVVEGKKITQSAELPLQAKGAPANIKAVKGAKYLFTTGKDGAVNEHIIVKRSGKNLQVFLNDDDDQPQLVIEDFYANQGELAGMGSDGQYHTFVTEAGETEAFAMMNDGAAMPLMMASESTTGLSGLSMTSAVAGGLSTGWLVAGAIGGLLALGGIAAAAGGGSGGGGSDNNNPPAPAPEPQPVDLSELVMMDRVGSLTGPIAVGGTTDDARPLFEGVGTPGNIIRVYDKNQLIGSVQIGEDGRWSWQPESNLPAGDHELSFSEMNRDGVEGPRSESVGFELDLTAPGRVTDLTLSDDAGNHRGPVQPGETTNDNTPTFSGNAEAGATVEIRDNGELIGTVLVGEDGKWSFTPSPALENGEHNFSVVVVDPAGNVGLPVNLGPIIIDDTLLDQPEFGYIRDGNDNALQPGEAINTSPIKMGGSGTPGDIVTIIRNGQPAGSVIVGDGGEWHYELVIPEDQEGAQSVGLIITSPEGEEQGRSEEFNFDFDVTAPDTPDMSDVTITDGNGNPLIQEGLTNATDLIVRGTGEEGEIVRLYDGDEEIGSVRVGADGQWAIPVSGLEEGDHQLRTEIEDAAGNRSEKSDSYDLEIDLTPPVQASNVGIADSTGAAVAAGDIVNSSELIFSGDAQEGDIVYLWDGSDLVSSVVVGAGGQWSLPAEMTEEREYNFQLEVRDAAGNSSGRSPEMPVSYDITAPDAPVVGSITDGNNTDLSAGGVINNGDITLSGQNGTPGDIVTLYNGNNAIATVVVQTDGSWSLISSLDDGLYNLSTTFTDSAGNESAKSNSVALDLDSVVPDAPIFANFNDDVGTETGDMASGSITDDQTPTLNGKGPIDGEIILSDASGEIARVPVDSNGNWSWTPSNPLAYDNYTFNAVAVSRSGVVGTDTSTDFVVKVAEKMVESFSGFAEGFDLLPTTQLNGATLNIVHTNGRVYTTNTATPALDGMAIQVTGREVSLSLELDAPTTKFAFMVAGVQTTLTLNYYDENNQLIATKETGVALAKTSIVHEAPEGQFIARIEIIALNDPNGFAIDNFEYYKANDADLNPAPAGFNMVDENFSLNNYALLLAGDEQVLDLSNIAQQQQDIHSISLEGHGDNTLNLRMEDVLALGHENLFIQDGSKQLMINGDAGDHVSLEAIAGENGVENWNMMGEVTVGGTVYSVYQADNHALEVLIQQGVQTDQH
ncbi:Ig-like domain (group 3) [Candidatus Pantoea symbiotica]|uniref:Ig-like domain (Group 3) n=3 Tax=Pantoea TaxID=53335 RepID=A0A1I3QS61_9GAMM|nr:MULTISPECIES: Ig-like domain-containing protein [Pantoea]SFJ35976.1 Ig-like domain (group 3) [Pantoea symbiotica]SFU33429.1 Ig-like domain (group 3) [Pantoea sp. YR525]